MSRIPFSGGQNLSGLQQKFHNALMSNELRGGYGAYELSHAGTPTSGYSFGPVQWDLGSAANNPDATRIFTDIIKNATDKNGAKILDDATRKSILDKVKTAGSPTLLTPAEVQAVNDALSSSYGIETINAEYPDALNGLIQTVDTVIQGVTDAQDKAFLENTGSIIKYILLERLLDAETGCDDTEEGKFVR